MNLLKYLHLTQISIFSAPRPAHFATEFESDKSVLTLSSNVMGLGISNVLFLADCQGRGQQGFVFGDQGAGHGVLTQAGRGWPAMPLS